MAEKKGGAKAGTPAKPERDDFDLPPEGEASGHPPEGAGDAFGDVFGEGDLWKKPFSLRFRFYSLFGLLLSGAWVWGVYDYVEGVFGWSNLTELLPHEVGGLAAGAFTPLALLWMVIAFWERGQSLKRDTESLRWHLQRLIYPSDKAETRIHEITESLRKQSRDLSRAVDDNVRPDLDIRGNVRSGVDDSSGMNSHGARRALAVILLHPNLVLIRLRGPRQRRNTCPRPMLPGR